MSMTMSRMSSRLVLCSVLLLAACGDDAAAPSADARPGSIDAAVDAAPGAPDAGPPPPGLWFRDACKTGEHLTIAAVGDVLLHEALARQAYASGHATLWSEVAPLITRAGIAYANFEGASAFGIDNDWNLAPDPGPVFDGVVYTEYPRFNYHGSIVPALLAAGFDVVSTANNHALDRGPLGIDRTLNALELGGLPATGTHRRIGAYTWYTIVASGGFRVAWLACAFSTNDPDELHQVLSCDTDADEVEAQVRALAARSDVDAVIVTPHGGDEYSHEPAARQVRLAARVLDAGALAVIGNHPHVVQPWLKRVTPDGRETFVIYSIGNFVSGQEELDRRASLILYLMLVRASGKTTIAGVRYVPTMMHNAGAPYALWPADRSPDPDAAAGAALVGGTLDEENALGSADPVDPGCPSGGK